MRCRVAGISVYFCLLLSAAYAQSTDATVTGTVLDPSGAPVADAAVSMQDVATGVVTHTKSNDAGIYLFAALLPGTYRLAAEHKGFQKYVDEGIVLEVGSRLNINVPLKVGSITETVEVTSQAEALETNSSTVGTVVTSEVMLELPLVGRSAYDLLSLQTGVAGPNGENFNGARAGALNITLDGINVRDNLMDAVIQTEGLLGMSVDQIQEFRIVTAPADAEYGRGSGQIQAISRSGTNQFHGALFAENRVTALSANAWFNNQRGTDPTTGLPYSPRNFLIRNQFGGRIGGPIRKNKTFFNIHYEGSRQVSKNSITTVVYTATALQGIYRFFPGVRNANAIAAVPTVDLNGNPVAPVGATGPLQSVSLYGRDPNRLTADPTGVISHMLSYMPLPNNFRAGDGLNTAGYTWQQPISYSTDQGDIKIDHLFTDNHRMAFSYSRYPTEGQNIVAGTVQQNFPGAPPEISNSDTRLWSVSFTSVLRPTLLNEFRAGVYRPDRGSPNLWTENQSFLPKINGVPYIPVFTNVSNPLTYNDYGNTDGQTNLVPVYQFGDNVTWLKGRNSFKGGFEFRFNSITTSNGFVTPTRALLAAGSVPVQNISTIAGIGTNLATAQQMLTELNGSLSYAFTYLNSPGGSNPVYIPGQHQYFHYKNPEFSWFYKDDLKVSPNLTLNLGVRYEWYGVPVEANGLGLGLVGGEAGLFGISGTNISSEFQPGLLQGSLTNVEQIGPRTPNPNTKLYNNSNLNFAPAVGLSWAVPGDNRVFGKGNTVLRAGYSMSYERLPYEVPLEIENGPGYTNEPLTVFSTLTTVGNLQLPLPPTAAPLATVPLTSRTGAVWGIDNNLKTGYYQNWNFSIQRAITHDWLLSAHYVGNKGTNLVRAINVNEVNIFENGFLNAFQVTQSGGSSPLFNSMFMGIGGVNGTTVTGSDYVRSNATLAAYLAQNSVGGLAGGATNGFNVSTLAGPAGSLLTRAGLPQNFFVVNPQFTTAWLIGNFGNSFYNALQLELLKRFGRGWTLQGNYSWNKTLGDEPADVAGLNTVFRTIRDRSLDKKVLDFNRTNVVHANLIYQLPFGPGKMLGRNAHGVLARVIGGWQAGAILYLQSGAPMSLDGVNAFNTVADAADSPASPEAVGPLSKSVGQLQKVGNGVIYFGGLKQVPDPSLANMTPALRAQSTLLGIANASGQLLMANAAPGQFGNIAPNFLTGPGFFDLDLNVMKHFRITEHKDFILRCDATNATNTPSFGNPNTTINSPNFGSITGTTSTARIIVFGARLNF
jgi:hypothetical protein